MATNVTMPQLGESVTEGTVTRWLKNVGDSVKVDEAIVEVSTDKVDTEIPSPVAGILLEIKTAQDAVVPVGSVMAVIGESNSAASSAPSAPVAPKVETPKSAPTPKVEPVVVKEEVKPVASTVTQILKTEEPVNKDFYATPIVRQLAKEKGIDLTFVKGSGTNGRITREDVLAATTKASPSAQSTQTFAPSTPPVTTPATSSTSSPKIAEPAKTTTTSVSAPNSTLRGKVEQTSRLRRIIA
ncbi:MAG: biotin/lipoyl-containing protein, partial [Actinomycetes bacterium]